MMKKVLLLVLTLLLTFQSAAAQDVQVRYGCRRDVPRSVSMMTRGGSEGPIISIVYESKDYE